MQRVFSHVDAKQLFKEERLAGEDAQDFAAESRPAIHEQQAARHGLWDAQSLRVAGGVGIEGSAFDGGGEQKSLAKGHGEPFSGDCVGRAGGIAEERDIFTDNAMQGAGGGDGAALA